MLIRISDDLHKQLKIYAATTGKKMIDVVEKAVSEYIKKNEEKPLI